MKLFTPVIMNVPKPKDEPNKYPPILAVVESITMVYLAFLGYSSSSSSSWETPFQQISSILCLLSSSLAFLWICVLPRLIRQHSDHCPNYHATINAKKKDYNNGKDVSFKINNKKERTYASDPNGLSMGSSMGALFLLALLMMTNQYSGLIPLYSLFVSCGGLAWMLCQICSFFLFGFGKRNIYVTDAIYLLLGCLINIFLIFLHYDKNTSLDIQIQILTIYTLFQSLAIYIVREPTTLSDPTTTSSPIAPMILSSGQQRIQQTHIITKSLSLGEWHIIRTFVSLIMTDYLARYVMFISPPMQDFIAVSHAGIIGCMIGCILASIFTQQNVKIMKFLDPHGLSGTIILSAVSALVCIEVVLRRCYNDTTVLWILHFLCDTDTNHSHVPFLSRGAWLIYWILILYIFTPMAMSLSCQHATQTKVPPSQKQEQEQTTPQTIKHYSIVISRKFFHFIAFLLFTPCTMSTPSMMVLSYAVAICVLLLLECLRLQYIRSKHATTTATQMGSLLQQIHELYSSFLDEKENPNGFLYTHVGLVFGCALPLWISVSHQSPSHLLLLPYLGILSLGVGDAMGAIVGTLYGKTYLSKESKRTLEGSLGVFVSIWICAEAFLLWQDRMSNDSYNHQGCGNYRGDLIGSALVMTIIEACTDQIDNLYLPFIGSISLILFSHY